MNCLKKELFKGANPNQCNTVFESLFKVSKDGIFWLRIICDNAFKNWKKALSPASSLAQMLGNSINFLSNKIN